MCKDICVGKECKLERKMDMDKKKILIGFGCVALAGIIGAGGYGVYKVQNPTPQELADAGELKVMKEQKEPKILTEQEIQELQEQGVIAKSADDITKEDKRLAKMREEKNNKSASKDNNDSVNESENQSSELLDWENMTEEEIYANRQPKEITKTKEEKNELKKEAKSFYAYIKNDPDNAFWEYDVFKNFVKDYEAFEENDSVENTLKLQESLGAVAGSFKNIGLIS